MHADDDIEELANNEDANGTCEVATLDNYIDDKCVEEESENAMDSVVLLPRSLFSVDIGSGKRAWSNGQYRSVDL